MGRRWWQHSSAALLLGAALALIGNLATSTVSVKAWWWPWLLWSLVLLLVFAAWFVEARRGLGGVPDDAVVARTVRDLAQRLLTSYEQQEWRHGVSQALPLRVRFRWAESSLPLGDIDRIVEAFLGLPRRQLIILGEPGAGKSVLALLLSRRLLSEQAGGDPVPLFLPISSWDPTTETVEDFVVRRLRLDHPRLFPTAQSARMLVTPLRTSSAGPPVQLVTPVLDGLDELPAERIPAAITKLRQFVSSGRALVVTCRSREYALITRDRPGDLEQAALIEIQPVAPEHVIEFLRRPKATSARWEPVFDLLRDDPDGVLATTLTTPLMAAMTRTAYREPHRDPAELTEFRTKTEITSQLIDRYMAAAYDPDAGEALHRYPPEKAIRWLGTLAYNAYEQGTRDLHWRTLPFAALHPRPVLVQLPLAAAGVLVLALLGFAAGSVHGAIAGTIIAALLWIRWKPLALEDEPKLWFVAIPVLALLTGLATGVALGSWWVGMVAGAAQGLAYTGLMLWRRPRAAALRVVVWWLLGVGAFASAAAWRDPEAVALWSMTAAGMLGGAALLSRFVWPWAVHRASHLTLAARGRLPLRLTRFMQDAYVRGVMRRSGAVWQFRHALINDRLAAPARRRVLFETASAGDLSAQRELAETADDAGDAEAVSAMLRRRVARRDDDAVIILAELLDRRGETSAALHLLRENARQCDGAPASQLASRLIERGDEDELRALAERGNIQALVHVYEAFVQRGDQAGADAVLLGALDNLPRRAALELAGHDAVGADLVKGRVGWVGSRRARRCRLIRRKRRRRGRVMDVLQFEQHLGALWYRARQGDMVAVEELAQVFRTGGDAIASTVHGTNGDRPVREALIELLLERDDDQALRRLEPHGDDVAVALGTMRAREGRNDEAIAFLRPVAPRLAEAAVCLAPLLTARGDADGAVIALRDHARSSDRAARELAELLVRRDDRAGAMAILRRWSVRDGLSAIRLAELHAERDEIREALEVLEQRVAREVPDYGSDPRDAAEYLFGFLRRRTDLVRLRAWAVRDRRALPHLAGLLNDLGDLDAAIAMLRPHANRFDGELAMLLYQRGDLDELRRLTRRGDAQVVGKYTQLLYEHGRGDEGDAFLRAWIERRDVHVDDEALAILVFEHGRDELAGRLVRSGRFHRYTAMRLVDQGFFDAAAALARLLGPFDAEYVLDELRRRGWGTVED
ncbi:hypothetical protein ACQP00_41935 [Dactylosporangium sp. CS-047395]|uniref:hypothetical protein n=1 Tax=Dactylosporangium sp. CS-047395 TaxID=3239936 RepID=UPI003D92EA23